MEQQRKKERIIFFAIVALSALGLGFSDRIFSNYFKEVYFVTALQRGFIEFPRELPGILCVFIIGWLSFLGEIKTAIIAQILSVIGLVFLGFITPSFSVMLIFLFINSVGMHLFFPLQDGIGIHLSEKNNVGTRMGQYKGISIAFSMVSSIIIFIGFRTNFFNFNTPIKLVLLVGAIIAIIVLLLLLYLNNKIVEKIPIPKSKFVFRKEYIYYYILATMQGAQKQIMFVFGPWVLIDILGKRADTLAILGIIGSFIGMFFTPQIGKWCDKLGLKKMLYLDGISYIFVYLSYGLLTYGYSSGMVAKVGLPLLLGYLIFVLDNMSMQVGMVKVVYLNSIIVKKTDLTSTLSMGISMDHILSILCGVLGGVVWNVWGAQYIFFLAALLSFGNIIVTKLIFRKTVSE
jgi:MFS family permease